MNIRRIILSLFLCTLFISCVYKHVGTAKVCDKHLFFEVYERSQLGVCYLTDSTNFRIYVGQLNFGLEDYKYECKNDTVIISRITIGYSGVPNQVTQTKIYNLSQLKKDRKFDNDFH